MEILWKTKFRGTLILSCYSSKVLLLLQKKILVWVFKISSVVTGLRCNGTIITVSLTAQCCSLTLHHKHQRLGDRGPGHWRDLETSLNNDLNLCLSRTLTVASCAHVHAAVFLTRHENLHTDSQIYTEQQQQRHNNNWQMYKYLHDCIGLHGHRAAQHGLAVAVQSVPWNWGPWLSRRLTL